MPQSSTVIQPRLQSQIAKNAIDDSHFWPTTTDEWSRFRRAQQWTRWAARQWARAHHPRLFHKMWVEEKAKHDELQSLLHR